MSEQKVHAILWVRCQKATFDTLHGHSRGQYHIALPDDEEIHDFFEGLPQTSTDKGGYEIQVPIEAFDGTDPVPAQDLPVRYMGTESRRKDWNIRSQRPATAYPLWRPGRGVPDEYRKGWREYAVLARDENDAFHARWISSDAFRRLPSWVRAALESADSGARRYP